MAITKLVITGNTTAVGISTTPITISLMNKAASTSVTPDDNITATNVQAALEELDDIKVQATNGTLSSPTITGTATFATATFTSLTTTGNVGVGLSSPSAPLHVSGNIKTSGGDITVESSLPKVYLTDTDNNSDYSIVNNNGSLRIFDETNSAVRMSIDSTGQLGIGVTSPSFKLDVDGNFSASYMSLNSNVSTPAVSAFVYRPASDELGLGTGSTERVRIDASGNVGIGTTNPIGTFDIKTTGNVGFEFFPENTTDTNLIINYDRTSGTYQNLQTRAATHQFLIGASTKMLIDSSGKVGIGISNPANTLTVGGIEPSAIYADATVGIKCDTNHKGIILQEYSGAEQWSMGVNANGDLNFYDSAVTDPLVTFQDVSGNVGIGTTSPASKLHVSSTDSVSITQTHTDGNTVSFKQSGTGGDVEWRNGNGEALILTGSQTRMVVDSSGNVGIGTTSPDFPLDVSKAGTSGTGSIGIVPDSDNGHYIRYGGTGTNNDVLRLLGVADAERMRIDTAGNVLVGKTASSLDTTGVQLQNDGLIRATKSGADVLQLNRQSTDGDIANFYRDGATVGSIGTTYQSGVRYMHIAGASTGIGFYSGGIFPCDSSGTFANNSKDLGSSTVKWDDVYATNGTIQTSDRNEKQDIAELSDAEQRVAVACKGLLRKFRWKYAVEEKGDEARIHFGIIAQDLQDAFTAEGLDAGDYAMFINSTWTDEETGEERSSMGVRYSELLAFIISAI